MPHLIIIAGSNGSGKTTAAPALLQDSLQVDDFVNADVIAQGLCAFQPEKAAIQAGRIMLRRIHLLAQTQADFAFETTLASRTFATWIPQLKQQGYQFHLIFLWLRDVELAILRVKERVKTGGHAVPEETIRRRYVSGLKNFFRLYRPLANSWQFYDNANADRLSLIAFENNNNGLTVQNKRDWEQLLETYSD
ncbi:MAG: zeta toxin family protein [Gammaproteobacteria bacterium]|nr:zeta toxin family protein [Gammaproteobacteria bacterium]